MSTWEQRMAQRCNVQGTAAYRAWEEYQRARCWAQEQMRDYVRGPLPLPDEYPPCCWTQYWNGYTWAMDAVCRRRDCDHEHHKAEVWYAVA